MPAATPSFVGRVYGSMAALNHDARTAPIDADAMPIDADAMPIDAGGYADPPLRADDDVDAGGGVIDAGDAVNAGTLVGADVAIRPPWTRRIAM